MPLVEPSEFTWLSGEELLTSYIGKHGAGKQFCSVCGSTLCGVVNGTVHGVTLGCLNGDPDIKLDMHIFVGSKAKWETIAEGVPQYQEGRREKFNNTILNDRYWPKAGIQLLNVK